MREKQDKQGEMATKQLNGGDPENAQFIGVI
jgi:hypothetical protein